MFYLPLRNARPTGGNRSKRNRLKSFMGKVANQLFSQKQEPSSNLLWGHVLKTCFFIFHLKQQKFILLSGQVWFLWEKKVAKTIAFVILLFLSKKTKHLKVKVFFISRPKTPIVFALFFIFEDKYNQTITKTTY